MMLANLLVFSNSLFEIFAAVRDHELMALERFLLQYQE